MAILEKLSEDERMLYEIMRNPVLFGEFYRRMDQPDHEEPFTYSNYQRGYIGDFSNFVSLCCGRAVGKTVILTDYIVWLLVNNVYKGEYILYTVPNKVHLEPVFKNLVRVFRNNPMLKHMILPKKGINSATNTITLLNSAQLFCRIAGTSGGGANVVGLHTPIIILDEAGFYPWGTWIELQPVLNSWQKGFKLFVAGVPTGYREKNVLYYTDETSDDYSKHRTASHENPRYTDKDEARNVKQYGGKESEDYIHFVLGRHGSPTFAVFDRRLLKIDPYPVYKLSFDGIRIKEFSEYVTKLSTLPPIPKNDMIFMGIDLGYTDPTVILILYEKGGIIKFHARLTLNKVSYPVQERLIDFIDTKYNRPNLIGIDSGNEKGLIQRLHEEDKYSHKNYTRRLIPIRFGAWLTIGTDQDGRDIRIRIKPQSVSTLQDFSNSHRIVYSSTDMDMVTELERMTYTKSTSGELIYRTMTPGGGKRGNDHNTAALLCGVMAYYMEYEGHYLFKKKKKLARSRWLR